MMGKRLVASALTIIALPATADTYQFQLDGAYVRSTTELSGFADIDADGFGLSGTFHFTLVDDSIGPFAEAAFLNKASNLQLAYVAIEAESGPITVDSDEWQFGGRGVFSGRGILEAAYVRQDIEGFETDIWLISGGAYITDRSSLLLTYTNSDSELDDKINTFALDYKNVLTINNGAAMNVEAGISYTDPDRGDSSTSIAGALDYYFTPRFGLGGILSYSTSDDVDVFSYGIQAQYFFNSHIAIAGAAENSNSDDIDISILSIALTGRF
jgi:hypothetical protein